MKKLMLVLAAALIFFSVLMLIFFPSPSLSVVSGGENITQDNEEEKKKVKAQAELSEPAPSGVHAQWIPAREAKILIDAGNAAVIDIRGQSEYEKGHIKGAKLMPVEELKKRAPGELTDQWKMILIYGKSGEQCAQAAKILTDMMYMNVFVFGAIKDWPYDIVQ